VDILLGVLLRTHRRRRSKAFRVLYQQSNNKTKKKSDAIKLKAQRRRRTLQLRVANPEGETLYWGPTEDFGRILFQIRFSLGFHIFIK